MKDGRGFVPQVWRARAGVAAAISTAVALALLLVACSGSPSSGGSGRSARSGRTTSSPSSSSASAIGFSNCMRAHGVANFPDPTSGGVLPKVNVQQLGVGNSQFESAQSACQRLLPDTGASITECFSTGDCPPPLMEQVMNGMLTFAQCMRSHGVPSWPDPTVDSEGRPGFDLVAVGGTDWGSPPVQNSLGECRRALPGVRIALELP